MICVFAEVFWRKMIVTFTPHFQLLPMTLEGWPALITHS